MSPLKSSVLPSGHRLLAAVVLVPAVINGLFALALMPPNRFTPDDPLTWVDYRVWAAVVAAALATLGVGILRRRRGVWSLLIALVTAVITFDVATGDPPTELLLPGLALPLLLLARARLAAEPYAELLARHAPGTRAALRRTRELLREHGQDSMAPFKMRSDVGHLFSAAGDAVVAFRVENRVLAIAGDPIGTPEGIAEVVERTRDLAEETGLRLGFIAVSQAMADTLSAEHGLRSIYLGCEAVVDPRGFSLEGRPLRKVRQAHARADREGYALERVRLGAMSADELDALHACRRRARPPEAEAPSFSMAPETFDGEGSEDSVVVRARHRETDAVAGFMVFMPLERRRMWTMAMQLRDPASPNGTMDAIIAHALLEADAAGVEALSLNFAAARRYLHEEVRGFWPRVARQLARLAMRWTQLDTLRHHNEKFSPTWEPRYCVVERSLEVPHIAFAMIWAEGQLPRPDAFLRPAWPQRSDPLPAF